MTRKELSTRYDGNFQYNPHKMLQAVLKSSDSHVVNPDLLTRQNTTVYLCPMNDAEDRYEIRAICRGENLGLSLTLVVSNRIRSGSVCWGTPPQVEIFAKEDVGVGYELAMMCAEQEAYSTALEYWKWGESPKATVSGWRTLCHYKREYLTDTFKYVGM